MKKICFILLLDLSNYNVEEESPTTFTSTKRRLETLISIDTMAQTHTHQLGEDNECFKIIVLLFQVPIFL